MRKYSNISGTKSNIKYLVLLLVLFSFFSCHTDPPLDLETRLTQLPPGFPPIEYPEDNEFNLARWELGKKLFYDPILSIDSTLSCGSCHKVPQAFADHLPTSPGVQNRAGKTNSPSLGNVAYHPYLLREGGVPTLEMQILVPIQEHNEFDHNIVDITYQLREDSNYVRMSREAYDRIPDPFVITRALANFERTLITGDSPYDRFRYQGKTDALDASEKRGMELFLSSKTNCIQCHNGFNFTDYSFRNNGLYTEYENIGRMRHTGDSADLALFKTPSLRNVALTAPYMHDGSIISLEEVIHNYDQGGAGHPNQSEWIRPLNLSQKEKSDLRNFLLTLTDLSFITNPAFAPPE